VLFSTVHFCLVLFYLRCFERMDTAHTAQRGDTFSIYEEWSGGDYAISRHPHTYSMHNVGSAEKREGEKRGEREREREREREKDRERMELLL
jgi:hypothetical protein